MNDKEFEEEWLPILEPIWKETDGFTMEEWEAWIKDDENKEKVSSLVRAFLALPLRATVFQNSNQTTRKGNINKWAQLLQDDIELEDKLKQIPVMGEILIHIGDSIGDYQVYRRWFVYLANLYHDAMKVRGSEQTNEGVE